MTLIIRPATKDDLESIEEIEKDAFPEHRRASAKTIRKRLELFPEGFYVSEAEGDIVGFTTALITAELTLEELEPPDEELHDWEGSVYYLRSVAVKKKYQKKSYGKLLVEAQLRTAEYLGKKIFRFTASKDVAGFYKKLGFKKITKYKKFYGSMQALWEKIIS